MGFSCARGTIAIVPYEKRGNLPIACDPRFLDEKFIFQQQFFIAKSG